MKEIDRPESWFRAKTICEISNGPDDEGWCEDTTIKQLGNGMVVKECYGYASRSHKERYEYHRLDIKDLIDFKKKHTRKPNAVKNDWNLSDEDAERLAQLISRLKS